VGWGVLVVGWGVLVVTKAVFVLVVGLAVLVVTSAVLVVTSAVLVVARVVLVVGLGVVVVGIGKQLPGDRISQSTKTVTLANPSLAQYKDPASKYSYAPIWLLQVPARYWPSGHTVQSRHSSSYLGSQM
jgi:hypothetical protein